jgi:cell division septum initiation protein DivIVA
MTDQALRRTDELLTELVEIVETARTVPMSSSIVLPRERVLDLLDELRETMPPEMQEARRTVVNRDALLHDAFEEAKRVRETAAAEAEALLTDARERTDVTLHEADVHAHEIIEAGRAEHAHLVSATGVHQSATKAAEELRAEAQRLRDAALADAEEQARRLRRDAEAYAAKLTTDAEDYTDRTLAELAETLQRSAATAEQGRAALARRRANPTAAAEPPQAPGLTVGAEPTAGCSDPEPEESGISG